MDRNAAWCLLTEFTQSESLRKHALAVEACMRAYGRKFAAGSASASTNDEELWGIVGLIHDFDYEKYPSLDDHPYKGNAVLKERGWPEVIKRAVMSHAEYTGVTRDSMMEKALFACDELAGFIAACAYVRPEGISGMKPKSVRKKLKQPSFAAGVNRDDVYRGAEELEHVTGMSFDEHLQFVIDALAEHAGELGLTGRQEPSATD